MQRMSDEYFLADEELLHRFFGKSPLQCRNLFVMPGRGKADHAPRMINTYQW